MQWVAWAIWKKRRIDPYPSLFIIRITDSFFFIQSVLPSLYVKSFNLCIISIYVLIESIVFI
jgi:hypothetical protein